MTDVDPFGDHDRAESRSEETTGETFPLTTRGEEKAFDQESEEETSFQVNPQRIELLKTDVDRLYEKLSEYFRSTKKIETTNCLNTVMKMENCIVKVQTPLRFFLDNSKTR